VTRSPASVARLTLLAGLAASQLTLLVRGEVPAFAIMAALSWLGGSLLLLDREEEGLCPSPAAVPWPRFLLAAVPLVWALLVLSLAGRLYDPLLHLLPLAVLPALGVLAGVRLRSGLMAQLLLMGGLLPAQVLINRFLPTDPLAVATARFGAPLLTLLGSPSFPEGPRIVMSDQVLFVDASCTGVNTMSLCLAATVLLVMLLPPPFFAGRGRLGSALLGGLILGGFALVAAFCVNGVRVALLGLTRHEADPRGLAHLVNFDFWHDGTGSHLFSLMAMAVVCGAYVLALEIDLRRRGGGTP
jgi:exosortase/archaeosortase family protein